MNISNYTELQIALKKRISTIYINDKNIANMFLIVDKLQYGQLPIVVLKRIDDNGICKITVAEGIVIPVTKVLADEVLKLYQTIDENDIEQYGKYKAKILAKNIKDSNKKSKLILVTSINPTPLGEGKTTMSIGIADGLRKIEKKSILALREPSLGPVFGIKGGAAGGGYSQIAARKP